MLFRSYPFPTVPSADHPLNVLLGLLWAHHPAIPHHSPLLCNHRPLLHSARRFRLSTSSGNDDKKWLLQLQLLFSTLYLSPSHSVCVCVYDMCVCVCVSVFGCADRKIVGLSSDLDSHKTDCTSFEHWQRCLSFEDIFLTIKRNNIFAFSKS